MRIKPLLFCDARYGFIMGNQRNGHDAEAHAEHEAFERCLEFVRDRMVHDEAGIYGPRSLTWEIMREPCALLAAPSAVLLQLAHPAIDGVSRYSSFATDYAGRAKRTFTTMYDLVFGSKEQAFHASRGLHAMHSRIRGVVSEPGSPWDERAYRANDQNLLRWVAVTLPVCVNEVFHTTVRPLSRADRERLYLEQLIGAAIVGVLPETMPATLGEFEAWYAATVRGPELHVGPKARALFEALQAGKRRLWLRTLSAAFLPPNVRDGYGLAWGKVERATFVAIVRTVRAANGILPRELRATLAFHQGMSRVANATCANVSTISRVAAALGKRFAIPSALSRS